MPDHIQVEMRLSSTARFKATQHQRSLGALTALAFRMGSFQNPVRCSGVFTARAAFETIDARFDRRSHHLAGGALPPWLALFAVGIAELTLVGAARRSRRRASGIAFPSHSAIMRNLANLPPVAPVR